MRRIHWLFGLLLGAGLPTAVHAQQADMATLVECRATAQQWNELAFSLMEGPAATEALGWRPVTSENPFLQEYDLAAPMKVFGRDASRIALTASGPMAVLEGVTAADLAKELGVTPVISTPEKFLGEKVVTEKVENDGETRYTTRISLNVSTVDTHPGKVLAGCSYKIETGAAQ